MPATVIRLHDIVRIIRQCRHYGDLGVVVGFTATAFIVRLPTIDIPYSLEDIELAGRLRNNAPLAPSPSTMKQRRRGGKNIMHHYRMCLPEGSQVKVISGSYTGDVGTIVGYTKSRVEVRVPRVGRKVLFAPKNIRLVYMHHFRMCYPIGSHVRVISGSYTGDVGTIVGFTQSRVKVRVATRFKRKVLLAPKNIRLVELPPVLLSDESTDSSTSNG